jgi:4-amino-4-deoxychorismate lyase
MTVMILSQQFLINGCSDASISPFDRGLAYGDGVFRTMRINAGVADAWELHYKKLVDDCNVLGIVCPTAELLLSDIKHLFTSAEIVVAKIIITRGESQRGYAVNPTIEPTRIVVKTPFPDYPKLNFKDGVKLYLCTLRLSYQPLLAGIKHLNRLENVMARREWSDDQIADGLLQDEEGNVIECTTSNLFARFGNQLITPSLSKCGVAGVTRQRILDASPRLNLQAEIAQLSLARLLQADEVIICNSLYGVWQVRAIGARQWPALGLAVRLRNILQK